MPKRPAVFAALGAIAVYAAFWGTAFARLGAPPAPLDDVFIHFGFARSLALGHPMEWIAGNGYSSGATSLTYPIVLAPFALVGFSGEHLGYAAALVGVVCIADALRSTAALLDRAPSLVRIAAPFLLVAVPLLDWSLCSGMETALLVAVVGRALVAVRNVARVGPDARPRAQRSAGIWLLLLVATRPEAVALSIPLGVAVAHRSGSLSAKVSMLRALAPTALFLGGQAALNFAFTGEAAAAGAVRKLLSSNPYASPAEVALEIVKNAVALRQQVGFALGDGVLGLAIVVLVAVAAIDRRTRGLALPLIAGALGALFLVCLNATARFQNLRYAAPSIALLLFAAALGVGALAARRGLGTIVGGVLLAAAIVAPNFAFARQIEHFSRASQNIRDQQIEVARRLAAKVPRARRVFVNDAGAIPYLLGSTAIDGFGLGGFRGLPFARASVHGVPAVIELLKHLDPDDRPDVLAVYPGWWPELVDTFGHRAWSVKIEHNVICGSDEKVVYDADWSAFPGRGEGDPPGVIDELDVADLVDERAHDYAFGRPHSGYAIGAVLADPAGRAFWDGGRIISEGSFERFSVRAELGPGPATLILRTDGGAAFDLALTLSRAGRRDLERVVRVPSRSAGAWFEVEARLEDVAGGDAISLRSRGGALRDFHLWITRP